MRNIELTEMQLNTVRDKFKEYILVQPNLNTLQVFTDADYPNKHNIGINYWDIFESDLTIEEAKNLLEEHFVDIGRKDPRNDAIIYKTALEYFKNFLDIEYGGVVDCLKSLVVNTSIRTSREEKITQLFEIYNRPMTARELTDMIYGEIVNQANVFSELQFLEQQGKVIRSGSKKRYQFELVQNIKKNQRVESNKDRELCNKIDDESTYPNSFIYKAKAEAKLEPCYSNGILYYPRNKMKSINALSRANYCCEVDNTHNSFVRRNSNLTYTEPHHLIPLSYYNQYSVSLDVEANIVSLCSNCHNRLHYGKDIKEILYKLYEDRKAELKDAEIEITFDELYKMYK